MLFSKLNRYVNKSLVRGLIAIIVIQTPVVHAMEHKRVFSRLSSRPLVKPSPVGFDEPARPASLSYYELQLQQSAAASSTREPVMREYEISGIHGSPSLIRIEDKYASPVAAGSMAATSMPPFSPQQPLVLSTTAAEKQWFDNAGAIELYDEHVARGSVVPSPKRTIRSHRVPFRADEELKLGKRFYSDAATFDDSGSAFVDYPAIMETPIGDTKIRIAQGRVEYMADLNDKTLFHRLFMENTSSYRCALCPATFPTDRACDEHITDKHTHKRARSRSRERDEEVTAALHTQLRELSNEMRALDEKIKTLTATIESLKNSDDQQRIMLLSDLLNKKNAQKISLLKQAQILKKSLR